MLVQLLKKIHLLRSGIPSARLLAALLTLSLIGAWISPLSTFIYANPESENQDPGTSVPGVSREEEARAHQEFDEAITDLENVDDITKTPPPKGTLPDDIVYLGTQKLKVYNGKERIIPLKGNPLVGLPSLMPGDFSRDVVYTKDANGDFVVQLYKKAFRNGNGSTLQAELIVEGLKVQSISVDRDYIAVLDTQNRVFVFDHTLVRKNFMESNLIPVRVASAPDLDSNKNYKIQWNHTMAPFVALSDGMDPNEYLKSGDLVIFEETPNGNKMVAPPIDIASIEMSVFERQSALATLVPNPDTNNAEPLTELTSNAKVREEAARLQSALIQLETTDVLYSYDPHAVADLMSTGDRTSNYHTQSRHLFTQYEWLRALEAKHKQENFAGKEAALEKSMSSLADTKKGLIRSMLSPKMLLAVATVAAGWYFTGVGYDDGIVSYLNESSISIHVLEWKLHLYSKMAKLLSVYDNVALTDSAIRSAIVLSFVVPFTNITGHLLSKFVKGFKNTGHKMAQCILGMRVFAVTMQIFIHGAATLIRQPLIVEAMRHGVNPFRYVRSDSYVAAQIAERKGAETTKGLFAGVGYGKQEDRKVAIEVMAQQREKMLSTATTIAFKLAADMEGVDPSLLLSLVDTDIKSLNESKLKGLLADKNFNKKWFLIANKMTEELTSLKNPTEMFSLHDIDPAAVEKLFKTAQIYAKKVNSMGLVKREVSMAHARWKHFWRTAMQKVGAWGHKSKGYLSKGLPSTTAVNIFYMQYTVDMQMMVWLIPLFSSRAEVEAPVDLAGDPSRWHNTSDHHKADIGEQASAYLIRGAAADALEFYEGSQSDRAWEHNPVYVLAEGDIKRESFLKSLFGFTKEALNLRARSYGFRFWSNFKIRLETFNSFLFWNLISRYFIGGSSMHVHDAIAATSWTFLWRQFYYGWIWDGLNRGKEAHMISLESSREKLQRARAALMQETRVSGNESSLLAAAKALGSLYGEAYLKGRLDDHGRALIEYFNNTNETDLLKAHGESVTAGTLKLEHAIAKLHEDLVVNPSSIGDDERARMRKEKIAAVDQAINEASAELLGVSESTERDIRLNALHLLAYSQRNIPKATTMSHAADTLWTYSGAISTTIIGTMLFAASQHVGVSWPVRTLEAAAIVSGLYFVAYNAQRIFNVGWDSAKAFIQKMKTKSGCKAALSSGGVK